MSSPRPLRSSTLCNGDSNPSWKKVATLADLDSAPDTGRLHLKVDGRFVSIIRHQDQLYCLDSTCFHAGGPLALGEIEDIDGQPCLRCPWHFYVVTLQRGHKLYQQADPGEDGRLHAGSWKSVGQRQRIHNVETRSDGSIWVKLCLEGNLASDEYACRGECGSRLQTGALRLAAADRDPSPVRARSASPMRSASPVVVRQGASPPMSPRIRSRRESLLGEGEDVWPDEYDIEYRPSSRASMETRSVAEQDLASGE